MFLQVDTTHWLLIAVGISAYILFAYLLSRYTEGKWVKPKPIRQNEPIRIGTQETPIYRMESVSQEQVSLEFRRNKHVLDGEELEEDEIEIGCIEDFYKGDSGMLKEMNPDVVWAGSLKDTWVDTLSTLVWLRRAPIIKTKERFPSPTSGDLKSKEETRCTCRYNYDEKTDKLKFVYCDRCVKIAEAKRHL